MSLMKKFKSQSKDQALSLLDKSVATVDEMQSLLADLFPYEKLSDASSSFIKSATTGNDKVVTAVTTTLDMVQSVSQTARTLEYFIQLHIPAIEDGGNFGVSIQLDFLKKLTEIQDMLSKQTDELCGYANARSEALAKISFPSSASSVTKSVAVTTTDGKKEEKASETKEEKESSASTSGPVHEARLSAVVAVDTLYYSKARNIFQACIVSLIAAIDFMDKNQTKLLQPKGSQGSSSGFSSMY